MNPIPSTLPIAQPTRLDAFMSPAEARALAWEQRRFAHRLPEQAPPMRDPLDPFPQQYVTFLELDPSVPYISYSDSIPVRIRADGWVSESGLALASRGAGASRKPLLPWLKAGPQALWAGAVMDVDDAMDVLLGGDLGDDDGLDTSVWVDKWPGEPLSDRDRTALSLFYRAGLLADTYEDGFDPTLGMEGPHVRRWLHPDLAKAYVQYAAAASDDFSFYRWLYRRLHQLQRQQPILGAEFLTSPTCLLSLYSPHRVAIDGSPLPAFAAPRGSPIPLLGV